MKKRQQKEAAFHRNEAKRQEDKTELDLQTSYFTLLPHMEEGFGTGYQTSPGIVSDTNQSPHEWLENVAKYMQTQGQDVGYSIPDVLAGEQQMRRLMRLPQEEAMRHQEMLNWRGVMAIMLLWDSWQKDDTWPSLSCEDFLSSESLETAKKFQKSVSAALTKDRLADGMRVFVLTKEQDHKPDKRPLCMLSRTVVLVPAANPGDLSDLLPAHVRWYDRARRRFLDPVPYLDESDRARLVLQLRLLQAMNEQPAMGSLLYSPDAAMCSPLERFMDDLQGFRSNWRERLTQGDEAAIRDLYIRTLAVYGLSDEESALQLKGLTTQQQQLDVSSLRRNPLIGMLMPQDAALPSSIADVQQTLYLLDGVPFARVSANWLLEPTNHQGEEKVLRRLSQEEGLLYEYSPEWNVYMAKRLQLLYRQMQARVGASSAVVALLRGWSRKHASYPAQRDRALHLYYPIEGHPQALGMLMEDLIGLSDVEGICGAFADCLLVITDALRPPFENPALVEACCIRGGREDAPTRYAIPPLSPWLGAWLMDHGDAFNPYVPQLQTESFSFVEDEETGAVTASFSIVCRRQGENALLTNTVTFSRTYEVREGVGGLVSLPASKLPYVVSWPNVRLSRRIWKQYFVYAHKPEALDVWVRQKAGWGQGDLCQAMDSNSRGQQRVRVWQTATTEQFPAYVVLRRGGVSLGVLVNDVPREQLKHEAAAVVGIDFGSIATTVMLRQGDKVQPAIFPRRLHGNLLHATPEDEAFLMDELIPQEVLLPKLEGTLVREHESTFYSVVDMFTDEQGSWRNVLRDGHIYYRKSLADLMRKNESTLYYDMKWGDEPYILHCMRLFLKQVMMQASLAARLCGAPSLSWRVSMPNALPLPRQESYLEMMRALATEVAAETGMPITPDLPSVLYATENQADGLYFRSRNEVNVRSGYVNMDIGGGTTDISLWLNNAQRATMETSLLLGCRQILFDSISSRHLDAFEADFAMSGERMKSVVRGVAQGLAAGAASTRGRQKSMFLLDDFFADYARDIWQMMAQVRGEGKISYVESLLLLNIGFLFHMCGELLNRSWHNAQTSQLLHTRMEICIAGNGGQLLKAFDNDTRAKLCKLALQQLDTGHPVRELMLVQSRHPKQEVAIGLLSDEQRMRSAVQNESPWNGQDISPDPQRHRSVMHLYPTRFFGTFPQAAEQLLPTVFEKSQAHRGAVLTPSASMELDTILDNEFYEGAEDDFVTYTQCFTAAKRLWRV